ncbi:MAG: hypothetical protein HKP01_02525, partial [Gemmatimonadetes bacterium]|nr:hypothetical protein [Gemmatimonadota bacterium]
MTGIIPLAAIEVAPAPETVLRTQGIPEGHPVPERVAGLVEEARDLYETLARPIGLLARISPSDFLDVYDGEGRNSERSPLPGIAARAGHMALFAATLGEPVSRKIKNLFAGNDAALGCMLDGIASERADIAANLLGRTFLESVVNDLAHSGMTVLPYSPGYCGWHVSGQRSLSAYLDPGQIGIELNASSLMSPIKSVSGVLVAGPPEIHAFDNDFDFCLDCDTWECRERIASLAHPPPTKTERSSE